MKLKVNWIQKKIEKTNHQISRWLDGDCGAEEESNGSAASQMSVAFRGDRRRTVFLGLLSAWLAMETLQIRREIYFPPRFPAVPSQSKSNWISGWWIGRYILKIEFKYFHYQWLILINQKPSIWHLIPPINCDEVANFKLMTTQKRGSNRGGSRGEEIDL